MIEFFQHFSFRETMDHFRLFLGSQFCSSLEVLKLSSLFRKGKENFCSILTYLGCCVGFDYEKFFFVFGLLHGSIREYCGCKS